MPRRRSRALTAVRLVHPFPSVLDGAVVTVVALVAGAHWARALAIGASMVLLQFAIGTVNDLVDAPADGETRIGKPIPDGVVSVRAARSVAIASAAGGLVLALLVSPLLAALAITGLAVGIAYDLRAKGTVVSWLPLAVGIPLLPVYGWLGATGTLPASFLVIVPMAATAGTALALANATVDLERDEAAGIKSLALVLGEAQAAALVAVLHGIVALVAVGAAAVLGAPTGWVAAVVVASLVPLGGAVLGLSLVGRSRPHWREVAWEIQAVGTGLLAVAWLGALSATGGGLAGA